jgi:hypothetical protein
MPVQRPREGEERHSFMRRCMRELQDSSVNRPRDQMLAICMSAWDEGPQKQIKAADEEDC